MRFGKRLAIAIETQGALRPFARQKELKHILIGVEKLSKTWQEQQALREEGVSEASILETANQERVRVGLPPSDTPLTEAEVQNHDQLFVDSVGQDVANLAGFVGSTENFIALAINTWLRDAMSVGVLFRDSSHGFLDERKSLRLVNIALNKRLVDPEFINSCSQLAASLHPITEAVESLAAHVELNWVAIHKLLKRRMKNLPESTRIREIPEFEKLLHSDRAPLIATSLAQMHTAVEDVYERLSVCPQNDQDPKATHSIDRLGYCLKLPSTTATSPTTPSLRT